MHVEKGLNQDAPFKSEFMSLQPEKPPVLARYATAQAIQGTLPRQIPLCKADTDSAGPSSRTTGRSTADGRCGYKEAAGYCPFRRRVLSRWRWFHESAPAVGGGQTEWCRRVAYQESWFAIDASFSSSFDCHAFRDTGSDMFLKMGILSFFSII
jgi:hypothetical protein